MPPGGDGEAGTVQAGAGNDGDAGTVQAGAGNDGDAGTVQAGAGNDGDAGTVQAGAGNDGDAGTVQAGAGDGGDAGHVPHALVRDVERARAERLERAQGLLDRLLVALEAGIARGRADERPAGAARPEDLASGPAADGAVAGAVLVEWLRRLIGAPVGSVRYEQELAVRMGPDYFGLRILPKAPPFLAGIDPAALRPAQVAPFLRRLSMTHSAPTPDELTPAALDDDPGPVTRVRRGARARRWGQPPKAGAPLLPAETVIPHLLHGIWLGGPIRLDGSLARNFAAAARRYAGQADIAVWTDVPRRCFDEADGTAPRPAGEPDPLAPARAMLAWARDHGIHLISIHEVFHAGHPMLLHDQYTAAMAEQLPHGYAGASDNLRLELIHLFGGAYCDGDLRFDTDDAGRPLRGSLPGLFAAVAASTPGFTLHVVPPDDALNSDVIIAPARHPAIRLWLEMHRGSYFLTHRQLFGDLDQMAQRSFGYVSTLRWRRYPTAFRAGWVFKRALHGMGFYPETGPLVRVHEAIGNGSELSWSKAEVPVPPVPLAEEQVTARAASAVATLAQQLIAREGDLHLTVVAPVIEALPDPGAAWVAVLALLAKLAEVRAVPQVTSVTQFRWADDGAPEPVALPPEAEALLDRAPPAGGWLGSELAAVGHPAWLLDEAVVPARLCWPPLARRSAAALRRATRLVIDADGTISGVRVPACLPPLSRAAGPLPVPPSYLAVEVEGHLGQAWVARSPITPESLAELLADLGLAGRPVLLVNRGSPAGGCPALRRYAERLAGLLRQPVLAVDGMAGVPQAAPAAAVPAAGPGRGAPAALEHDDGEELARAASVLADAMVMAQRLPGFLETGREVYRLAGEQMAGQGVLLRAMDTRLAARLLADAQIMDGVVPPLRDAAREAAADRILSAYRTLAGTAGPRLPGGMPVQDAVTAAGAVAGLLAAHDVLSGDDHATAVAGWRARLGADPRVQREIKAVRQRIAGAQRRALEEPPWPRSRGGDVAQAVGRVADRIAGEIAAGRWPGLAHRLALLSGAAQGVQAAAAVRVTAGVVAECRMNAAPDSLGAAAGVLAVLAPERSGAAGGAFLRGRLELAREQRLKMSALLLNGLREAMLSGVAGGPAVAAELEHVLRDGLTGGAAGPAHRRPAAVAEAAGERAADAMELSPWLARLTGLPVGTPEYEDFLAQRRGPDLFGLRKPPPPPPFLVGVDSCALTAAQVAPFLRELSMTRPPPDVTELAPAALDADAGRVSRARRGARARRWGQPPKAGAPLLPAETEIPHVVHGIWLGGPLPVGEQFARNFAAGKLRYGGEADFALWTDVPRRCLDAAWVGIPPRPGDPDPLAAVRAMLAWAGRFGIHLISVPEVFHAGQPMLLHAEYAAEMAKQLPRGYAGASDLLRLDIIYRFGGAYVDGDNRLGADTAGRPLSGSFPALLADVAASVPGFTLHVLPPGQGMNNDVIIAPARHPAVRLLCETARLKHGGTEPLIFGGRLQMTQRAVWTRKVLLRYPLVHRTGRTHHVARSLLGLSLDDARLPRVDKLITYCSELSWARAAAPPPAPLTREQVTARAARATATLARQLITRHGDLHLPAVAPVIAALPDPDAAWIAILTLLAELMADGTVPPVTSVTQFRWRDDGAPEHITLPPEAEALLVRAGPAGAWLGAGLAAPGQPAWLLDEAITPATLRRPPARPFDPAALRRITGLITGIGGSITGLRLPAFGHRATHRAASGDSATPPGMAHPAAGSPAAPGSPPAEPPMLPGYLEVHVEGRLGQAWIGQQPVPAESLALLLCDLGLTGRPVLLVNQASHVGGCPALHPYATRLAALLGQPVLAADGMAAMPRRTGAGRRVA